MYEVAFHLKKFVYELDEIPYTELLGWMNYFERRPVDWRDDDRTYKLMRVQGCEQEANTLFPSLAAIHNSQKLLSNNQFNPNSLKGSIMFQKMMTAKGGEKLEF